MLYMYLSDIHSHARANNAKESAHKALQFSCKNKSKNKDRTKDLRHSLSIGKAR